MIEEYEEDGKAVWALWVMVVVVIIVSGVISCMMITELCK